MSRHLLWLVWAAVAALAIASPQPAAAQSEPVKPYIVFILDTSGSMIPSGGGTTGFGPPSCPNSIDDRLSHAKCAIYNIANSYGEMVLALGRFRVTYDTGDSCSATNGCNVTGYGCSGSCDDDGTGTCAYDGDQLEVLAPLLDNNQESVIEWTDFACGECDPEDAGNHEIYASGATPLAGSLIGAKRYWQGLNRPNSSEGYWEGAGDDPIVDDPLNDEFLPSGEQCRPYITILLTDGDETCAPFTMAEDAAESLLTTQINFGPGDTRTYRIETKPIGFGKDPGDSQIERLAHAGGTPDDGDDDTFEGAYAQNEEELQLEISAIIADAIKFERCNGEDDDCDDLEDEDFPEIGDPCDDGGIGVCRGTGVYACNDAETGTECVITDPGAPSTTETCNGLDDDCDGTIDEGACQGCLQFELCNGEDDDCDGLTDEDLVRSCGTDVGECTLGEEHCCRADDLGEQCAPGTWVGCTGQGPVPESCNGDDDDCNGTVDGFVQACTTLPPPGNPGIGPCHEGTQVCPTDGSGEFGPCLGEIVPVEEGCDGKDNDCDGPIDEGTGGADCSTECGPGTTVCVDDELVCDSDADPTAVDVCNGVDDDCDGQIDEDAQSMGDCSTDTVCLGENICLNGSYVCVGEGIQPELCNCEDDDCDTMIDDGNICGSSSACVDPVADGYACQCAQTCSEGEFPCADNQICVEAEAQDGRTMGYCVIDPCHDVTCVPTPSGDQTECVVGQCVPSCQLVECPEPLICYGPTGACRPDDCSTFPEYCQEDELCVAGECVADPCEDVACAAGEYCFDGGCYGSCTGVECPGGQRCELGVCVEDPCGAPCPTGQICDEDDGECQQSACSNQPCQTGQWCNPQNGQCEPDPCLGVTCPGADEVCVEGTCNVPSDVAGGPDADLEPDLVTAGGRGGCDGGGGGAGALVAGLLGLAAAFGRRRGARAEVRS